MRQSRDALVGMSARSRVNPASAAAMVLWPGVHVKAIAQQNQFEGSPAVSPGRLAP
jgi:hypothetical protein